MTKMKKRFSENDVTANNQIRFAQVRVDGSVMNTADAIKLAQDRGEDLILIAPNAQPPVCRIVEMGKYLYELKRKAKEKEKQERENRVELKELRFGAHTDDHDFNFKKNHAYEFLKRGDKVKAVVLFKGREIVHKELGELLLLKLATELETVGKAESMPKLEGKRMFMVLAPKK